MIDPDETAQTERPPSTKATEALARLLELNRDLIARAQQLEGALESRIVIEQAKGILAARHGVGVDAAFDALRRGARSNHLKLHDLARRVVDEAETPAEVSQYLAAVED